MDTNKLCSIYACNFNSLKEYMVPLKTFFMMVQQVENYPGFAAVVYDENKEAITDDVYCVPYPYRHPICPEMAKYVEDYGVEATVNDYSKAALDKWYQMIQERTGPIINNGLRSKTINNFDNEKDSAIIISTLSGKPIQFEYNNLVSMETCGIPFELPRIIHEGIGIVKTINEIGDAQEIFNVTPYYNRLLELTRDLTVNSGYMGFYKFVYQVNPKEQRVIWLKGSPGPMIVNLEGFKVSSEYIHESTKERKKIIFTI